jgi:hypothetical protein
MLEEIPNDLGRRQQLSRSHSYSYLELLLNYSLIGRDVISCLSYFILVVFG